ncbi:hypothetical protein [Streptomyces sp. NPDC055749]
MTDTDRMLAGLLDASHGLSLEQLPSLLRDQAAHAGIGDPLMYVADRQEDVLRLVTCHGLNAVADTGEEIGELQIDGTLAGHCFTSLESLGADGGKSGQW